MNATTAPPETIFPNWYFGSTIVWTFLSALAGLAVDGQVFGKRDAMMIGVVALAVSCFAVRRLIQRLARLDEMQQLMLWRALAAGGAWIGIWLGYMAVIALVVPFIRPVIMIFVAPPLLLVYAAYVVRSEERRLEEPAN